MTEQHQGPREDVAPREDRTVLDVVETRLGFRAFFAKHAWLDLTYRIVVGLVGAAVVALGIVLIPLPGPGWLIVFAGLAILATEFAWAERLLGFARQKVYGWTDWVTEQSLAVRALIGLLGLAFVAAAGALYLAVYGLPGWVPSL
ncbi:MAG: TIGR02611 family protein [Sporichthyaceae bacterium]